MTTSDPEGIFDHLVGHDGAKAILRNALRGGDVHIMLTGPPASGKSVALLAIEEAIEGAKYIESHGLSERKLRDTLSEDPPALLLDEFDDMKRDAFKALNTALEQGRVIKNVTGDSYDREINTQVFVACNNSDKVQSDILDRFVQVDFKPHSKWEFTQVCMEWLPQQVDWIGKVVDGDRIAALIAEDVWKETENPSIRTALYAAKLANSLSEAQNMVTAMQDSKADIDSDPITPEELPHTDWVENNTEQSNKPKSLDDIRKKMADEDSNE